MCHEPCAIQEIFEFTAQHAGMTSGAMLAGGPSMLIAAMAMPMRKARQCGACGYDLSATISFSLVCPECGAEGSGVLPPTEARARVKRSKLLVGGASGTGKSSLFRALAGIWPFGRGTIRLPERAQVLVLPQRPYFPLGSLRQALTYPSLASQIDDAVPSERIDT